MQYWECILHDAVDNFMGRGWAHNKVLLVARDGSVWWIGETMRVGYDTYMARPEEDETMARLAGIKKVKDYQVLACEESDLPQILKA